MLVYTVLDPETSFSSHNSSRLLWTQDLSIHLKATIQLSQLEESSMMNLKDLNMSQMKGRKRIRSGIEEASEQTNICGHCKNEDIISTPAKKLICIDYRYFFCALSSLFIKF
ncbi:hypothetical protein QN277_005808 [Acacia crassicarpa]|uniref:Uncharacterized protein n=1 Tax=Acacia crassicarpa TaxID=499986 RepID=A0AAE1IX21_9FABA|nr:hypothetical protein QN277_005808 [Acacia crassicarpa]